jgi:outer membrane protein
MLHKPSGYAIATLALWAMLAAPASAVDLRIGLGAGIAPDYEGSDDYTGVPLWNLTASNLYHQDTFVALVGTSLRSNLLAHPNLRLGLSGQYKPERDDVEDERVDQMRNIDGALMVGVLAGYDFDPARDRDLVIELDARADVAEGNGALGTLRGRWAGRTGPSSVVRVEASSTYASEDYMSEYFGVSNANAARSGLDRFDADDGFKDIGIGVNLDYNLTSNWILSGTAAYTLLLGDAADSPIVDDRGNANQFFLGALINYKF